MDRISGTSLSKCLWNQCPSGRGMSVQVSLDWVSKCAWNPQLEYQLRDFIAHNIESLKVDGKSLRLYVDDQGRDGIEYPTGVGPIDILAVDSDGAFVVFELKRGRVADRAIGQISRYMGWLITNREEGTKVKGVIVAKDISQNLRHAVVAVPNVSLFEYHISFTLNEIKAANAR